MKTASFQAGMMLAGLVMLTILVLEGPRLGQEVGIFEGAESTPVLVFVIPDPSAARRVRSAFSADRIVWQGPTGLALVGERVVASNLDGASEVIMAAGWVDHPIRVVRLDAGVQDSTDSASAGGTSGHDAADRMSKLRELTQKPTLTRSEQVFILSAMNDGVAI